MHRNRSKWDRLLTSGDVRGMKFVEREGKRKLPVMECVPTPIDPSGVLYCDTKLENHT